MSLTKAIHRTIYSSMKLLKYWLRMRRPGPIKAVSWRCNSLLVMCATYRVTATFFKWLCLLLKSCNWRLCALKTWTYHQLAGDLRDCHAKGEQVQAAVPLKQLAGWLLKNDEGHWEHEPDLRAGTQYTGVLHKQNVSPCATGGHFSRKYVCALSYSNSWAIFSNASIQNDIEVVVAGVEGPSNDANDGEDVQLQSDNR